MTVHLAGLLAANLVFLAAGIGISRCAGLWTAPRDAISWLGVAYVLGIATVGVVSTLELIAGLDLTVPLVLATAAVLAALGAVRRRRTPRDGKRIGAPAIVAPAIGAILALLLVESTVQPLDTWDSWAIWTMKARALVLLHGLDPRVFAGAPYSGAHLDYPLFLPSLEAIDFRFMGALDDRVIHVQLALVLVGFVAAAERMLRGRADPILVWPMLALVSLAPATLTLVEMGYADVTAAALAALAALAAWIYVDEGQVSYAVVLGVTAAGSAATKRDVWPFVVALVLVTLVAARLRRRSLLPVAGAGAAVAATIVPWAAWLAAHHVPSSDDDISIRHGVDPVYLAAHASRAARAVEGVAYYALRPDLWLLLGPVALAALIWGATKPATRGVAAFAGALLLAEYLALVWAFWASTRPIAWHIDHAAPRVVATGLYVAALFVPLLLSPRRAEAPAHAVAQPA